MKKFFALSVSAIILSSCVSSGVEPNWGVAKMASPETPAPRVSKSGQYRVELRRSGSGNDAAEGFGGGVRIESTRNGVRVGANAAATSTRTVSRQHSSAFGVGRIGHPISVQSGRDSFVVVLESLQGNSLVASVAQQTSADPSRTHLSPASALNTRVISPLGQWSVLGGITQNTEVDGRNSSLDLGSGFRGATNQAQRDAQNMIEIRVSPWDY